MDEIDIANEQRDKTEAYAVAAARANAAEIPQGQPGDCDYCGKNFSRLVGGACGRCRDERKLP